MHEKKGGAQCAAFFVARDLENRRFAFIVALANSTAEFAVTAPASERSTPAARVPVWLAPAFFASGFAALIYQVVWQRVLFASFGINIEAVTIVVTAFLAGLGLGSLAGGRVSTRNSLSLLRAFAAVEASIGMYGLISVRLFRWLASYAADLSEWGTGIITFVLVLIPTMLMGFTLPLLVAFAVRRNGNVGSSVGQLYFVNTAGSALASLMAAAFMMGSLGESRSVMVAAFLNITVAAVVFLLSVSGEGRA
jgi:predicted membrane-bound spermidine synthase